MVETQLEMTEAEKGNVLFFGYEKNKGVPVFFYFSKFFKIEVGSVYRVGLARGSCLRAGLSPALPKGCPQPLCLFHFLCLLTFKLTSFLGPPTGVPAPGWPG